ncbi:putative SP-containing protein [Vairimorpha necatrix]|uniref:SP-containing protein n=1 Tax=Vairimorpha necatrix TaxID=6039 RepID=A0AAX4J976_9MICR
MFEKICFYLLFGSCLYVLHIKNQADGKCVIYIGATNKADKNTIQIVLSETLCLKDKATNSPQSTNNIAQTIFDNGQLFFQVSPNEYDKIKEIGLKIPDSRLCKNFCKSEKYFECKLKLPKGKKLHFDFILYDPKTKEITWAHSQSFYFNTIPSSSLLMLSEQISLDLPEIPRELLTLDLKLLNNLDSYMQDKKIENEMKISQNHQSLLEKCNVNDTCGKCSKDDISESKNNQETQTLLVSCPNNSNDFHNNTLLKLSVDLSSEIKNFDISAEIVNIKKDHEIYHNTNKESFLDNNEEIVLENEEESILDKNEKNDSEKEKANEELQSNQTSRTETKPSTENNADEYYPKELFVPLWYASYGILALTVAVLANIYWKFKK